MQNANKDINWYDIQHQTIEEIKKDIIKKYKNL